MNSNGPVSIKEKERELEELKEKFEKNDKHIVRLSDENKQLREKIEKLEAAIERIVALEKSNKKIVEEASDVARNILLLTSEVAVVKQLVTQIASDVEAIKESVNKQDTQKIMGLLLSLNKKQQRDANKVAMQEFNTNVQNALKQLPQRYIDKQVEQSLLELLACINERWSHRVNSEDDVAPELQALCTVVTQDLQNLVNNGLSKYKFQPQLFSQHMPLAQYVPTTQATNKNTEQATAQMNGSQHSVSIQKCAPAIYVDVDENEVTGLGAYIMQSFPGAVRYEPKNVSPSGIILTFIIVHDRLDMNRWVNLCDSRTNRAAKHFVVLVCNSLGDAARANGSEKLPCTALYKAAFDVQYDKSGMGRKPQQVYNKQSMDTCFAAIKSAM
jgi:hypothetical protein